MKNPTRRYLEHLKALYLQKPGEYTRKRHELAAKLGLSGAYLYNLAIPKQNARVNFTTALKMELLTDGAIPADSVCPDAPEILRLVARVQKRRGKAKVGRPVGQEQAGG